MMYFGMYRVTWRFLYIVRDLSNLEPSRRTVMLPWSTLVYGYLVLIVCDEALWSWGVLRCIRAPDQEIWQSYGFSRTNVCSLRQSNQSCDLCINSCKINMIGQQCRNSSYHTAVGARIQEVLCEGRKAEIVKKNRKLCEKKTAQTGQRNRKQPI